MGDESICTVPDTNDWYLKTAQGITLGPYQSREEAVSMLKLLALQERPNPRTNRWRKT